MAPDSSKPANDDASAEQPSIQLTRRGFARRIAELAGGAALAALAGGNARVSAAQRGTPVAHTYCVPGEVLAVARHSGALTHKHVAQRLRAHPLLGDALFAGIAPGANDAATLLEHCERLSASANAPAGAVSAGRSEYGSGSAGHNKDK